MQIMKLTQKWVFDGQTRPNKIWNLKDQFGLKLGENRMGEREKKRGGRGRREEEEGEPSQKGMETHLVYESYEIMHEFPCFDGYPLAQI